MNNTDIRSAKMERISLSLLKLFAQGADFHLQLPQAFAAAVLAVGLALRRQARAFEPIAQRVDVMCGWARFGPKLQSRKTGPSQS